LLKKRSFAIDIGDQVWARARPGATSLANVTINVIFLELKQYNQSIENQVWARG
jgi:hypothetical protein